MPVKPVRLRADALPVLLTGATGYLGGHLLRALLAEGRACVILKRRASSTRRIKDVLASVPAYDVETASLETVFERHAPGIVVHCATDYGRSDALAAALVETNVLLPARLLDVAVRRGSCAFVNCDTGLGHAVSPYALAKKQFREWLERFSGRLTAVNIVLEQFYGPDDNRPQFASQLISGLLRSEAEIAMTKGEQSRDFVYIADAVDAVMTVIRSLPGRPPGFAEYAVGTGQPVTIREFAELAKAVTDNHVTRLAFGAVPYRPNEMMQSQLDSAPLRALGWRPKVTLAEGLRLTVAAERGKVGA